VEHLVFAAHLFGFCFPLMQSYTFVLAKVRAQKCVLRLENAFISVRGIMAN